ncbi:Predicted protein [Prochlorococcus marinus subsp. marinus str. CCMP1375]|uniref:Uncharacterized protein n=2 Tax=Prochlorococcaceae TaxID=2881426 RepID=Q7VCS0_PROMA|nr:Predicted protein [Prochlorococcus marinus subsp. marinus str. CCMP1375]
MDIVIKMVKSFKLMDASFFKALELADASRTTSLVVWSMLIFLAVLLIGLSIALVTQIKSRVKKYESPSKKEGPKGF